MQWKNYVVMSLQGHRTPFRATSLTQPVSAKQSEKCQTPRDLLIVRVVGGHHMVYVTAALVRRSLEECGIINNLLFQNQTFYIARDLFSSSLRRINSKRQETVECPKITVLSGCYWSPNKLRHILVMVFKPDENHVTQIVLRNSPKNGSNISL